MHIMLVENKIDELRKLQSCVAQCYPTSDIIPFSDSSEAMKFIRSDNFFVDICFLSVMMPGVTGFGLAEEIREHNKAAKVVFVADTPDYALDAWQHYASDYLLMPITLKNVQHTLVSCFPDY